MPELSSDIHPSWREPLAKVENEIEKMGEYLRQEMAEGRHYLPSTENILRAFRTDFDSVRVLIVGQDPYPTQGHPIGLSFAVSRNTRPIPRSLQNIFRELQSDLKFPPPAHGDLSEWSDQGVLLINRVLTVSPGNPGSHRGRGWEAVTDCAIQTLADRKKPLVAILWGKDAQGVAPLLKDTPIIASAHPSPMSARRGFFGSSPFSRANQYLIDAGANPVDWRISE